MRLGTGQLPDSLTMIHKKVGSETRERTDTMEENKSILNEEEINNASGGMIVDGRGRPGVNPAFPWQAINNNNGQVLGTFPTRDAACQFAKSFGKDPYNVTEVSWEQAEYLRQNPNTF